MNVKEKIVHITSEYLEDKIDFHNLSNASKAYGDILKNLCEEEMNVEEGRTDIHFENGKALGTFWAALCLDDLIRTRQFIRGIDKAIKDKTTRQEELHILYAGTGPFATLLLPLILRYSKEDIRYTFMEINPFSFELVQKVISKIGLENYDINFVQEDATQYRIDPNDRPDIIISETMQNGLVKEQQVPIFLNLMDQAKDDTIFIPENISLFIGLQKKGIPTEELLQEHYHKEKRVLEISKDALFPLGKAPQDVSFDKLHTKISREQLKDFNRLLLLTEIQIYQDEKIEITESGLTTPMCMYDLPEDFEGTVLIETQYQMCSDPKLDFQLSLPS